jgi:hypothetical protein
MKIVFYKTFLCPRCFLTGRALARLRREFPELEIETVEVTRYPQRAWQDGVRMLPAVCREGKVLTGLYLTDEALRNFLRS